MTRVVFRFVFALFAWVCLSGCPSDYHYLEELYFKDDYIQATIKAAQIGENRKSRRELKKFFSQNSKPLKKNLLLTLDVLKQAPTKEDVDRVSLLVDSVKYLVEQDIGLNQLFLDELLYIQVDIQTIFLDQSVDAISYLVKQKYYRQAYELLIAVDDLKPLEANQLELLSTLKSLAFRTLTLSAVRVHDETITALKNIHAASQLAHFQTKGHRLMAEDVNLPQAFGRHLEHFINKEKSLYLNITDLDEADYRLDVSVGYEKREELLETKEEKTDFFNVKFAGDEFWHPELVTYEVFTKTYHYVVSVQAVVYLNSTNEFIRHHVFEVLVPLHFIRLGHFVDLNPDIIDMEYSKNYKQLQVPLPLKTDSDYIDEACSDAAEVLAIHLVNTIDVEPLID